MNVSYYLFGTGKFSELALMRLKKYDLCGYIDNSEQKIGTIIDGTEVISLDVFLQRTDFDAWIVIAVSPLYEMEIAEQLLDLRISKFVFYDEIDLLVEFSYEKILAKHNVRLLEYYRGKNQQQRERISFFMNHLTPKSIHQETGYKRKRQLELIEYAHSLFSELEKMCIHPFLTCGNLLGKYRHDGFIPWDDDLDFGLFRDEYEKLIAYCKAHYRVIKIDGTLSNKDIEKELGWIDSNFVEKPDTFLIIYPTQLQLNYGTSLMDRLAIDFWCFDRYSDESFATHNQLIDELKQGVGVNNYGEQFDLIDKLQKSAKPYIDNNGKNVYFSLDSGLSILRSNEEWIDKDTILPLQRVMYEGFEFYAPNRIEEYLFYEYKDVNKLPADCGIAKHFYRDAYIRKNYITVEFYLVDAFEIYHFKPLYDLLRSHGIYAIFVAEPKDVNTAGKWFDYDKAVEILNKLELEFSENCNIDADVAFSTQFPRNLRKYRRAVKVNMTYGCSFNKNGFWFDKRALKGFDFKIVGGEFIREKCLEKNILGSNQVLIMGTPKHYGMRKRLASKNSVLLQTIQTNKKIICYFPTWDEDSSILRFANSISELKNNYYIVTKPHHCTFRLPEKKNELALLYEISDLVLDGNYDFEEIASIGDIRLCDAKSGAALESIYVNPRIPTIFLSEHSNIEDYFYSEIFEVTSSVIYDPKDLKDAIEHAEAIDTIDINRYFDERKNVDDLWEILQQIVNSRRKI